MIEMQVIILGLSLLGLVILNIVLGSVNGFFEQQFDKTKFIRGLIKGIVVVFCFVGILIIGNLNPDIAVVQVDGKSVNIGTATYLLMLSGYYHYGKESVIKLTGFVQGKFNIDKEETKQ